MWKKCVIYKNIRDSIQRFSYRIIILHENQHEKCDTIIRTLFKAWVVYNVFIFFYFDAFTYK